MRIVTAVLICLLCTPPALGADTWYVGDLHCTPPENDGTYSAPYHAQDHPGDYPVFEGADKPGWSCSYQRDNGTIIQFGDSRTPQEQWLAIWGASGQDR